MRRSGLGEYFFEEGKNHLPDYKIYGEDILDRREVFDRFDFDEGVYMGDRKSDMGVVSEARYYDKLKLILFPSFIGEGTVKVPGTGEKFWNLDFKNKLLKLHRNHLYMRDSGSVGRVNKICRFLGLERDAIDDIMFQSRLEGGTHKPLREK